MSSPPVPVVSPPEPPQPLTLVCANCHADLTGEYCAACGQRHEPHIHTVGHFAGEAFESISHADSRLWRTLWYLLTRPGFLTREFFAGRRAGYLPPFRLYLVISLLFFVIVGMPGGVNVRTDGTTSPTERVEKLDSVATELEQEKGPASNALKLAAGAIRQQADKERAALGSAKPAADATFNVGKSKWSVGFCDQIESYRWLKTACAHIAEDGGTEFGKTLIHNIPRAMFLFLPLLALAMKPLYLRPKRYYVEHLLFLIHNHAFVFLALSLLTLIKMIPVVGDHVGAFEAFVWLYLLWYLFRAMRNAYAQGRALTLAKYFAVGFAYTVAGVMVLLLTALYSAMTFA
ncbi:MAG: DUF3667 domain-containing protein [Pseudomonadota bacterium]